MPHFLQSLPRRLLLGLVHAWRLGFSSWLAPSCRFEPSCSAYALQALERHGAAAGSYLALRRLTRCHPWCEPGYDPVPDRPPALFTALLSHAGSSGFAPRSSDQNRP